MLSFSSAIPDLVFTPTAQTMARPDPYTTRVLQSRKGLGSELKLPSLTADFSTWSGSPVIELSSAAISVPDINRQSAGILIPY